MKKYKLKKPVSDDFMKKVIIAMAIFLLLFTIAILIIFSVTSTEPSTLIAAVFAACLGEGSILGVLKSMKIKHLKPRIKDEQEDDTPNGLE